MIKKIITFLGFAIASILLITAFVTAKTFTQLSVAVLAYPVLVFFAYKLFITKSEKTPDAASTQTAIAAAEETHSQINTESNAVVTDIDKRAFLKLLGATGISMAVYLLLNRRFDNILWGNKTSSNLPTEPVQPTAGYSIADIDNIEAISYYGFTNNSGEWYIMREDLETGTYRYARGKTGFSAGWNRRTELTYDYFHSVFSGTH